MGHNFLVKPSNMINDLLITSIKGYSIAELVFTSSLIMLLAAFVCWLIINLIRLVFKFNAYKSKPHFLRINRTIGIVAAIFASFIIVAIIIKHF